MLPVVLIFTFGLIWMIVLAVKVPTASAPIDENENDIIDTPTRKVFNLTSLFLSPAK